MGALGYRIGWLLVAVALSGSVAGLSPSVEARQIDPAATTAFTTSATGLLPATSDDRNVAIGRLEVESGASLSDPVPTLPGFVIVIDGTVLISADETDPVAILNTGDVLWLSDGVTYAFAALDGPAAFWRVAISPDVSGRDISRSDQYTLTLGDLTGNDIPAGAVRQYTVHTGLLPAGTSAAMGGDGDKVMYAFTLDGTVILTDEDTAIDPGSYVSPFFETVTAEASADGAALAGFIAQGPIIPLTK